MVTQNLSGPGICQSRGGTSACTGHGYCRSGSA